MIACLKCSKDNQDGLKYCEGCGAVLPQMAPTGATSSLDVESETEYVKPDHHFPSEEMLNLAWGLHDFLEEGAEIDPFIEVYETIKERLENYLANIHQESMEFIASDRSENPDDPYPRQVQYLISRASSLAEEGITSVEKFLDALDEDEILPEVGRNGVTRIIQANDHFLLALQMTFTRSVALAELADQRGFDLSDPNSYNGQLPENTTAVPAGAEAPAETEEQGS